MFHALDEFRSNFWNAPTPHLPRFEFVFFSSRRTVSGETRVTMPSFNICCTNNSSVQRARPAGGSLQAKAIKRASCSSLISAPVGACGLSSNATCNPSSANRNRIRRIVYSLTYSIWLISASVLPSSTFSRICARWMTTALFWPLDTIAISFLRSVSTSWTLCFSLDIRSSYLDPTS